MSSFLPVQAQPFYLAGAGASLGDTSVTLSSFTQINGTTLLTMADFGSIGFATIEPGNGTFEEQICFTGVTQNANGTATLTGVSTVLFVSPYTQTSGLAQSHAGGVQLVLSNTSGFENEFPALPNNATITGLYTFTNPNYPRMDTATPAVTLATQLVPKAYVDSVAIAGAPNGTIAVQGLWQAATATQAQAGVVFGSTGAGLVPPSSIFTATGATNAIRIPVTKNDGKLSSTFGSAAGSFATLDNSVKVVQNPASASSVANFNTIPISGTNVTQIADGFLNISATQAALLRGGSQVNAGVLHTHSFDHKISIVTSPVTLNNSSLTTEQTLFSVSVPANTLSTTNGLRLKLYISSYATGASTTANTIKFKYGGTTLTTHTISSTSNLTGKGYFEFILLANASVSSQIGFSQILLPISSFNLANAWTDVQTGTATETSSSDLNMIVTVTWDVTGSSAAVTMNSAILEQIA